MAHTEKPIISWGVIRLILAGAAVLCLLQSSASAAGLEEGLFVDTRIHADLYRAGGGGPTDATVVRSRLVWVDARRIGGEGLPGGAASVVLNLFGDASHPAVRDRLERRSAESYTWFGRIEGVPRSQATLVVDGDDLVANIVVEGVFYQVRPVGDGVHSIREIDQSAFPDEIPPITPDVPAGLDSDSPPIGRDDASFIDIMVVYTPAAASASGNITAEIQLAIDETNTSFSNSGITQRLRLVHAAQVAYVESGNMNTDLIRLTSASDGYMDNVHTLRNAYGADCVSLWIVSVEACGIAWFTDTVSPSFESSAFSVVEQSCATGYYSFGHELGHNMSARHDWYVDTYDGGYPCTSNKAYVDTTARWRTIMGYNDDCSDLGFSCARLQYWSNPDVTYGGAPMGVPECTPSAGADNRKALNASAFTVANFRQSVALSPLTTINLVSPVEYATPLSAPTFLWSADGGTNNVYAVDFSLSVYGPWWSTYANMHITIGDTSWTMPNGLWSAVPAGGWIYWRVRGADLDEAQLTIVTSDEMFWFYKY